MTKAMTHTELVIATEQAMRDMFPSVITFTEPRVSRNQHGFEIPDVFGLVPQRDAGVWSITMECKVQRSDYLRDAQKPFRQSWKMGLGDERWLVLPEGLAERHECLESHPGWGLIVVRDGVFEPVSISRSSLLDPNREIMQRCEHMASRRELALVANAYKRLKFGGDDVSGSRGASSDWLGRVQEVIDREGPVTGAYIFNQTEPPRTMKKSQVTRKITDAVRSGQIQADIDQSTGKTWYAPKQTSRRSALESKDARTDSEQGSIDQPVIEGWHADRGHQGRRSAWITCEGRPHVLG